MTEGDIFTRSVTIVTVPVMGQVRRHVSGNTVLLPTMGETGRQASHTPEALQQAALRKEL